MTDEKRQILDKINGQILKLRNEMLDRFPAVHEIEDDFIIRFFTDWDNCRDSEVIKYKKIPNLSDPDESVVFFFIPKNAYFDLKQHYHIGCMTCLSGKINITVNNEAKLVEGYSKICVHSADVQGKALENTYILVTSHRKDWDDAVREHVKEAKY